MSVVLSADLFSLGPKPDRPKASTSPTPRLRTQLWRVRSFLSQVRFGRNAGEESDEFNSRPTGWSNNVCGFGDKDTSEAQYGKVALIASAMSRGVIVSPRPRSLKSSSSGGPLYRAAA
jgi:hypothetical protein